MRILIIGGTSSLGGCLKKGFSETHEVVTAGRSNCDIRLDLHDTLSEINFPPGLDVIINTAAHFGGNEAKDMLEAETVNVLGTLRICEAAKKVKAKHLVLVSSMSACLGKHSQYYGIYALSKKHADEVAELYCATYSLPLTILRPSQIYGNENSFRKHQPFIYSIADRAENGADISIYGSNDALRNYIHVDDLYMVILRVIQERVEGRYSCTHPVDVTYSQIARAAYAAFKTEGQINFLTDKDNIPDNIFEKDNSLYEKIGFYPEVTIEEGMKRLASYRKSLQ